MGHVTILPGAKWDSRRLPEGPSTGKCSVKVRHKKYCATVQKAPVAVSASGAFSLPKIQEVDRLFVAGH